MPWPPRAATNYRSAGLWGIGRFRWPDSSRPPCGRLFATGWTASSIARGMCRSRPSSVRPAPARRRPPATSCNAAMAVPCGIEPTRWTATNPSSTEHLAQAVTRATGLDRLVARPRHACRRRRTCHRTTARGDRRVRRRDRNARASRRSAKSSSTSHPRSTSSRSRATGPRSTSPGSAWDRACARSVRTTCGSDRGRSIGCSVSLYRRPLLPHEVAELERRTGGWVAALQLFNLATTTLPAAERNAAIAHVGRRSGPDWDFLADNVLNGLPDELQLFLLETAPLERLTAPLCDDLLGERTSALRLAELDRLQLVTSSMEAPGSFRSHEVLRAHLEGLLMEWEGADAVRKRYRQAAETLERHGQFPEALRAYCRGEDWPSASRLLGARGAEVADRPGSWLVGLPSADGPGRSMAAARRRQAAARRRTPGRCDRDVPARRRRGAHIAPGDGCPTGTPPAHVAPRPVERSVAGLGRGNA